MQVPTLRCHVTASPTLLLLLTLPEHLRELMFQGTPQEMLLCSYSLILHSINTLGAASECQAACEAPFRVLISLALLRWLERSS